MSVSSWFRRDSRPDFCSVKLGLGSWQCEVTFVFLCWERGVMCDIYAWLLIMNVSFMFH